jgi:multidrug efflux system membrane fusion protein
MSSSLRILVAAGVAATLSACGGKVGEADQVGSRPEVAVAPVVMGPVSLTDDLPGRVLAVRTAEIRPQVGGIVMRRLFTEGGEVMAGQPLFQINPAPFRADADSARAVMQRAEATRDQARVQAERLKPLIDVDAVSRQTYDNAVAGLQQAEADVAAARAALARRRLDLDFATIRAPIAGRIGAAAITEGALVSAGDATALAVVQQLDQVHVDVRLPVERQQALQAAGPARVEILSGNGAPMGLSGRVLFSELLVDSGTGDVRVRVLVDNPAKRLLPGLFVRVRLPRGGERIMARVPQQAVAFADGRAQVLVIDPRGVATLRPVTVGPVIDGQYVVTSGLARGQSVVVEGRDRVMPGQAVKATAWARPAAAR